MCNRPLPSTNELIGQTYSRFLVHRFLSIVTLTFMFLTAAFLQSLHIILVTVPIIFSCQITKGK